MRNYFIKIKTNDNYYNYQDLENAISSINIVDDVELLSSFGDENEQTN